MRNKSLAYKIYYFIKNTIRLSKETAAAPMWMESQAYLQEQNTSGTKTHNIMWTDLLKLDSF